MAENKIELKSVNELLGMKFFIPSYQRGYRWTEQQVKDLLNDIEEFRLRNKSITDFYCLQPLVVRENIDDKNSFINNLPKATDLEKDVLGITRKAISEHTKWEVIDGQQRLTTILIILSFLSSNDEGNKPYSIDYQTRNDFDKFLNKIKDIDTPDILEQQSFVKEKFDEVIKNDDKFNNIDFYHIFQTLATVKHWFNINNNIDKNEFKKTILNRVKFIWYESVDENPIKVFTRLNIGKISLTNAELIKALFLNQSNFPGIDNNSFKLKQQEIASGWDIIEYTLQNDEFWLFLHKNGYNRPTRIDFIFDLICDQNAMNLPDNTRIGTDGYRTFRYFYEYFKQGASEQDSREIAKVESCWDEVKKYFQTFQEWFNDLEMYHYVGVLLSDDFNRGLSDIVRKWTGSKNEFLKYLKDMISNEIKVPDGKYFCNENHIEESLHFDSEKKLIRKILLMHNIQTVINQNKQLKEKEDYQLPVFYKFPFHLFKKEKWDVEHIDSHSKNDMNDKDSKNEFLLNIYYSVDDETQKKIEAFINNSDANNWDDFIEYTKKPKDSLSDEEKDQIWNFTLLDYSTNRSYGNSIFTAKRRIIIGKDRGIALPIPIIKKEKNQSKLSIGEEAKAKTAFIPPCTKNVFMKYYTPVLTNYNYWTKPDADAYKQNILDILKDFKVSK
ncbi:MAG: DUF262 domain-containing protein [Muribaculaceae bacterium]|nr:DUF262 domain-containing protein [Muribaculaceae bacterium]